MPVKSAREDGEDEQRLVSKRKHVEMIYHTESGVENLYPTVDG